MLQGIAYMCYLSFLYVLPLLAVGTTLFIVYKIAKFIINKLDR